MFHFHTRKKGRGYVMEPTAAHNVLSMAVLAIHSIAMAHLTLQVILTCPPVEVCYQDEKEETTLEKTLSALS